MDSQFAMTAWDDAGVRVIQVSGEFDVTSCERFRSESKAAAADLVVVDLRRATFMDSGSLSELIALRRDTEGRGATLAILRPESAADRIFKLTGMDGHLPLHDGRVPLLAQFNYG